MVAIFASCGDVELREVNGDNDSPGNDFSVNESSSLVDGERIDYYEDIAPIVMNRCVSCHGVGEVAFDLLDYEDLAAWGDHVGDLVSQRDMPPWNLDNSGQCQSFKRARWMDKDEIETINTWIDAGMPEGDPADAPPVPPKKTRPAVPDGRHGYRRGLRPRRGRRRRLPVFSP
ncbi:MAG: hypothetical protein M5R36_01500 [Deltaproteobacteria bacterium]|nr:hypothetical protein [Deltaproteobacteria bacterium]